MSFLIPEKEKGETYRLEKNLAETEGYGIPYHLAKELFDFCKYGSLMSVASKMLLYTGCRISEINNMKRTNIHENIIYWKCGKRQKVFRKEYLPDHFLAELNAYWATNKLPADAVISVKSKTLSRYFRRDYRPFLSKEWNEKRLVMTNNSTSYSYKYALKGFRKNFATQLFIFYWSKYSDASVAVDMVSKRMKHSSRAMTVSHYIESVEEIEAEKFSQYMPSEIIGMQTQKRILDY